MKLGHRESQKGRISLTMRNWLPLLQCPVTDLENRLKIEAQANPFLNISSNAEISYEDHDTSEREEIDDDDFLGYDDNYWKRNEQKNSVADAIEATTLSKNSLYDILYEQINAPTFPTPTSQKIAYELINFIDENGFFDGDITSIAKGLQTNEENVENIRLRFERLTPCGVGAKDLTECFMFQLREYDIDEELYQLVKTLIINRDKLSNFHKEERFSEAITIFKKLRNPPAIDYLEESAQVIPDVFVYDEGDKLIVELNDPFYPVLEIENKALLSAAKKEAFVRAKIKEARDLIDAVNMRKDTIKNIGLMIVEHQYDFFKGGEIRPMNAIQARSAVRSAENIWRVIAAFFRLKVSFLLRSRIPPRGQSKILCKKSSKRSRTVSR